MRWIIRPSSISANSGFARNAARNCLSSSEITRQAVLATAVALRGDSVIAAISPKISPGLIGPIGLPLATSMTSPSSRRYILSRLRRMRLAFSFSMKNLAPAGTDSSLPADSKNARAIPGT